jgi:penicillin amidase
MQLDDVSLFARDMLPHLRGVPAGDERARKALALLAAWDGAMDVDRPQPLIFNAWMRQFRQALLTRAGVADSAAVSVTELIADALSPQGAGRCGGDCTPMLASSLDAALGELAPRFGPEPSEWHWGRAHRTVFAHPLLGRVPLLRAFAERRIASPGDDTTLFRGGMRPGSYAAVHGASYRGVYDLADLDRSRFMAAPGQSGHLASPLAWNFVRRWRDGGTIALGPEADAVAARIRLIPQKESP